MSNTEELQAKFEVIKKISDHDTIYPPFPVDVYIQEAEDLYQWALHDVSDLLRGGITQEFINDLSLRIRACREAQSVWKTTQNIKEEAQNKWKAQSPLAYELRNQLTHDFRFAFRKKEDLLKKVQAISENSGHADMIQDLSDLSVLGLANQSELKAISFDVNKLQLAATKSAEMGKLLGLVNGEKGKKSESMIFRDKAFTHLKEAVDEIRDCGKFVFWKNPERLNGYKSEYISKLNKKKNKEKSK